MVDRIVGLDLSLTGSGVAVLEPERQPRLGVFASRPIGNGIRERWMRLDEQATQVTEFIDTGNLEDGGIPFGLHAVVEQPPYASPKNASGSQHERAGLWWTIMGRVTSGFAHVSEVPPATLKKFATGKGNASKPEMMAALVQAFPGLPFKDDNDCDAMWLAVMGRAHHDPDLAGVQMYAYRTAALKAVAWG